jgi:hypothetical protein
MIYSAYGFSPTKNTSHSSDEFDHGTRLLLFAATTSARTRVSTC